MSNFEARLSNQARRIQNGITSGALSARETQLLGFEQQLIQGAACQARADGLVDPLERRQLSCLQDAASRDIYALKHNEERNPFMQGMGCPTPKERVDERQARQSDRIEHGLSQGQLTTAEAQRLVREQARIQKAETAARSDGQLSEAEKLHLERMQNRASISIYLARHNSIVPR
jgi:tellurite resistance protein